MAAYKSGLRSVLIPHENLPDLREIDKVVAEALEFVPVTDVAEVLSRALVLPKEAEAVEEEPRAQVRPVLPAPPVVKRRRAEKRGEELS